MDLETAAAMFEGGGHTAIAFDLPGLGDDHTPAKDVTWDSCAARLCEVLSTSPEPAIVAGNSMGGISGAALMIYGIVLIA
jgi:pimeloyl-ACP methyl ester carboxylesterase